MPLLQRACQCQQAAKPCLQPTWLAQTALPPCSLLVLSDCDKSSRALPHLAILTHPMFMQALCPMALTQTHIYADEC